MFFEKMSDIDKIASRTSCSIFVIPPETKIKLKHALFLTPSDEKKTALIGVEQIRDFLTLTGNIETSERFYVVTPADAMNEAAQNAFLKTFEEPREHCHFVLLTMQPNALLPTIRSRAQIFYPKTIGVLDCPPHAKERTIAMAKKLIAANTKDLPGLATELTKNKTQPRQQVLEIVGTAIELLYKSYFKTKNVRFLDKLPKFLLLYDNLNKNCHIKLHIVADLC